MRGRLCWKKGEKAMRSMLVAVTALIVATTMAGPSVAAGKKAPKSHASAPASKCMGSVAGRTFRWKIGGEGTFQKNCRYRLTRTDGRVVYGGWSQSGNQVTVDYRPYDTVRTSTFDFKAKRAITASGRVEEYY